MRFSLIHPSIINLYINTLNLHLLQEKLESMESSDLTDDMRETVSIASNDFSDAVETAEKLFGSSDVVQDQLDTFASFMGDA